MAYKAVIEAREAAEKDQDSVREAVRIGLQMRKDEDARKAALLEAQNVRDAHEAFSERNPPQITLTGKMVSRIARAMDDAKDLGYLQRLDLIARSIGFSSQASMMSALKRQNKNSSE